VWIYPEEALTQSDEARDMQHPVWIEMLQLQPLLVQQPEQEWVRGIPEPTFLEREEAHNLIVFLSGLFMPCPGRPPVGHLLRRQQPLLHEILQLLLSHDRRSPVRHCDCKVEEPDNPLSPSPSSGTARAEKETTAARGQRKKSGSSD
jgi:hypothetical protein